MNKVVFGFIQVSLALLTAGFTWLFCDTFTPALFVGWDVISNLEPLVNAAIIITAICLLVAVESVNATLYSTHSMHSSRSTANSSTSDPQTATEGNVRGTCVRGALTIAAISMHVQAAASVVLFIIFWACSGLMHPSLVFAELLMLVWSLGTAALFSAARDKRVG